MTVIIPGIPYVQGKNNYDDRDGLKYGIAIHNTSNNASDSGEASYATWRTDGTSSHLYADSDSVTQSLDTARKAGHAGSSTGNENAIAVEITGGNGMSRAWWLANVAWDKLAQVLATVIRHHWPDGSFQVRRASVAEMRANPKVKAFYGHDDMRLAWGGTTHTDPGTNFPWDRLFSAVNAALGTNGGDAMTDLDYGTQWPAPPAPGNRPAKLMLAELWTEEQNGRGAYGTEAKPDKSHRQLQLDRIETAVTALAERETPAPVAIPDEQLERVLRKVLGMAPAA